MMDDIQCFAGSRLSEKDRAACISLIVEGGAVKLTKAEVGLPQAKVVAINRVGQEIVGVGAIKRWSPQRASILAGESEFPLDPHSHELGYIVVKEGYKEQKRSHRITAALLSEFQERPLFATTSAKYMKQTLSKAGFVQRGKEWRGTRGDQLSLWIKDGGNGRNRPRKSVVKSVVKFVGKWWET